MQDIKLRKKLRSFLKIAEVNVGLIKVFAVQIPMAN